MIETVFLVLAWDRLTSQGSFAEFVAGAAGPVEGSLRLLLAVGLPLATVTMVAALWAVARGARSVPSRA